MQVFTLVARSEDDHVDETQLAVFKTRAELVAHVNECYDDNDAAVVATMAKEDYAGYVNDYMYVEATTWDL